MAKLLALAAYFYQALIALGLLVLVSNLLPASEFATYSLFASIVHFADIACFQWLRSACTRHYPGPLPAKEPEERGTISAQFLASAGLCLLVGLATTAFELPAWLVLAAIATTILQGWGELHLTMLRFRQEFRLFSWLQGLRASLLALATATGAAIGGDVAHAVLGTLAGNALYAVIAALASHRVLPWTLSWNPGAARRNLAYGGAAAGASIASVLAPLFLKTIFVAALGPAIAAGPLLALDLLQRPFGMIIASLQAVRYPGIVARYDSEGDTPALRTELGRYYAVLAGFAVIGAAGLIAILPAAAAVAVPAPLRLAFLQAAPLITLLALLRTLTHTLLATPAHLHHRLPAILALALIDSVATCAAALGVALFFPGQVTAITAGATAGAAAAALFGLVMLRRQPFRLAWQPLLMAMATLAVSWLGAGWMPGDLILSTVLVLGLVLALGGPPLVTLLRWVAH